MLSGILSVFLGIIKCIQSVLVNNRSGRREVRIPVLLQRSYTGWMLVAKSEEMQV